MIIIMIIIIVCAVLCCTVLSCLSLSLCHWVRHPVVAELHPTVLLVVVVKDVIIVAVVVVVSSSSLSFLVRFIGDTYCTWNRMISKHTNLAIAIVVVVAILLIVDEIIL